MKSHKIIVTGPIGSGKTTLVQVASDYAVDTEEKATDATAMRKGKTTVAMDYGTLHLRPDEHVHFYGTPGQVRFDFMWDVIANDIARDCIGVILMIDNARNYPYRDLKFFTDAFLDVMARTKTVIGVTRSDIQSRPTIDVYHSWLKKLKLNYEVFYIDARKGSSALSLVRTLVAPHSDFEDWESLPAWNAFVDLDPEQEHDPTEELLAALPTDPESSPADAIDTGGAGSKPSPGESMGSDRSGGGTHALSPVAADRQSGTHSEGSQGTDRRDSRGTQPGYQEKVVMKEQIVKEVMGIRGVKGSALATSMGDIVESTIDDARMMDFISFVAGVVPVFEDAANLGKITEVILKSPEDDLITLYVEEDQSLGVIADNRTSVRILKQQILDMLQWD